MNRWVGLKITGDSVFTQELVLRGKSSIELPIRHGEGRLKFYAACEAENLKKNGGFVLRYEEDVNGSDEDLAGISSHGGRVFGLMPHPESFWCEQLHPSGDANEMILGTTMFESAYLALK